MANAGIKGEHPELNVIFIHSAQQAYICIVIYEKLFLKKGMYGPESGV